jgi:hypothetical protein
VLVVAGSEIERCPPFPSHSKSIVYRIADTLNLIMLSSLPSLTLSLLAVIRINSFRTVFAGNSAGTFSTRICTPIWQGKVSEADK